MFSLLQKDEPKRYALRLLALSDRRKCRKDFPTDASAYAVRPNAGSGRLFAGLWRKGTRHFGRCGLAKASFAIARFLAEASKPAPLLALLVRPSLNGSGIESEFLPPEAA